jgi:hypothetical protein
MPDRMIEELRRAPTIISAIENLDQRSPIQKLRRAPTITSALENCDELSPRLNRKNKSFPSRHTPTAQSAILKPKIRTQSLSSNQNPVSWSSLPRKDQLLIMALARLSEPLTQTSIQAYIFYQLKSFDPSMPDSTISTRAGILLGSFTATQALTAFIWGRAADSKRCGRKKVLMLGLLGMMVSSLGLGFSRSYASAVVFRCLGGALNGNSGILRTVGVFRPHPVK